MSNNTILYAAEEPRAGQPATPSLCEESQLGFAPSLDGGQRQVMINDVRAERSESVLGSFSVTLLELGMTISGCLLRQAAGQCWISLPGSIRVEHGALKRDSRGRVAYRSLIRFRDKNAFRLFQARILQELRRLGHLDQDSVTSRSKEDVWSAGQKTTPMSGTLPFLKERSI